MNSKILSIILHIGAVIKTVKDIEQAAADIAHSEYKKEDFSALMGDISTLVEDGILAIPGMTTEQVQSAISDFQKSL